MNKLTLLAAAGLLLAGSAAQAAGTATSSFNVTVGFTSTCVVKTGAGAGAITLTYAALQTTAATGSTSATFQCTRGLTPQFSFDATSATQTASAAAATGTQITAEGLISGIRYTLTGTTSKSTTGTAATAGANGTGGSDGSADEYLVNVSANADANQAGAGGDASGSQTRVITISY